MKSSHDGPVSPQFQSVKLSAGISPADIEKTSLSAALKSAVLHTPQGACAFWGIPFFTDRLLWIRESNQPIEINLSKPIMAEWLVFLHTADVHPSIRGIGPDEPKTGIGRMAEHAADYVICYSDGSEKILPIRHQLEIGTCNPSFGFHPVFAEEDHKPHTLPSSDQQASPPWQWGQRQTRVKTNDEGGTANWIWAWKNPHPRKSITSIRFAGTKHDVLLLGLAAGTASSMPLQWGQREKAVLSLPAGRKLDTQMDPNGLLKDIQLDMGQIISAQCLLRYPNKWEGSYNNQIPQIADNEILIEYTAHPDARFHLWDGSSIPINKLGKAAQSRLTPVAPARQRVTLRVVEKGGKHPIPVKLHVHGEAGEYLAPLDRHRNPNPCWFEDYSVDFTHRGIHNCTYIDGECVIDLPIGKVYIEISKGFEIKPVRKVIRIGKATREIALEIEKVLSWREKGWVTADTHVHFLSPHSALLEGKAEGVNVVNLLASRWGELVTNVGDFDGKTTLGSKEADGDGEYLVRVGTENRQHLMGHISLLGYSGRMIVPLTVGGPTESALGDPVDVLLTEWGKQCKKQGGLSILPHFPYPRLEGAASIVSGAIDGVEMTSWGELYAGISPYSLVDWYRYLNCGYLVAAVGGTDKMDARTAVGTIRTYAQIEKGRKFDYHSWMDAVRKARTFVTYGPLMEFSVEGKPAGASVKMTGNGGAVDVNYSLASVTVPMSRVELIVNGEIRESKTISPWKDQGSWSVRLDRSSWIALLVRGHYPDKPEIIAAHSSPVMVKAGNKPFWSQPDAVTILEQIEGALAYLDTMATRAEAKAHKRMRLALTSAHREVHSRMHANGHFHQHTAVHNHKEHRK